VPSRFVHDQPELPGRQVKWSKFGSVTSVLQSLSSFGVDREKSPSPMNPSNDDSVK